MLLRYLKSYIYNSVAELRINIISKSINSDLAFATKTRDWKYENEVRLIVYNPNKEEPFYSIELDNESEIEAIYFGYRCPKHVMETIKNVFVKQKESIPKFLRWF